MWVHAGVYRLSQNSNGGVNVAWRPPHLGTRKLHCTVAHAVQGHRSAGQREAAGEINLSNHLVLLLPFIILSCIRDWMKEVKSALLGLA
jgi:hypothetical protein